MPDHDRLEEELGVSFNDKSLLTQALVHSSFLNENPGVFAESNERLEFLGDAVLELMVSGVLLGLGEGLAGPPSVAFFADIAPPGLEGVTMGLFRTFGGVGSLVGALLLGGVADLAGFAWSLTIDAVLLLASGLGVMLLVRETARRRPQES